MRLFLRIAVGIVVLAAVVVMINLGLWQLSRHDEKQDLRDQLAARQSLPELTAAELLDGQNDVHVPDELEYRRLTANGHLLCDQAVLVRNRTLGGRPGYWVFMPLQLAETTDELKDQSPPAELPTRPSQAVMVNAGWIPRELVPAGPDSQLPWLGGNCAIGAQIVQTRVSGLLLLPRNGSGRECESVSSSCTFAQPDLTAFASHYQNQSSTSQPPQNQSATIAPTAQFYLQLEDSTPAPTQSLTTLGAPEFSLGNHRSYAVQWFIFATIAAVGVPLIYWRNSRRGPKASKPPAAHPSSPPPETN